MKAPLSPFVIPSEAEGSAVPRTLPGNVLDREIRDDKFVVGQHCGGVSPGIVLLCLNLRSFLLHQRRNSKCGEETHGSFLFMLWSRNWFESGSVSCLRYPSARDVAAGPAACSGYRNGRACRRRRNQRESASDAPVVALFTQLRGPLRSPVWAVDRRTPHRIALPGFEDRVFRVALRRRDLASAFGCGDPEVDQLMSSDKERSKSAISSGDGT
jgi:hypothetical protein